MARTLSLLFKTILVTLMLAGTVVHAGFINEVTVTLTTKKAGLGDLVKEAEKALGEAQYAVSVTQADLDGVYRSRKTGAAQTYAIKIAQLVCLKAKDTEKIAKSRLENLRWNHEQSGIIQLGINYPSIRQESKRNSQIVFELKSKAIAELNDAGSHQKKKFSFKMMGKQKKCNIVRAEIQILYGNRICSKKIIFLPIADVQLKIPYTLSVKGNHLRESLSERAKVRVIKYYEYTSDENGEPVKSWGDTIWDITSIEVTGKVISRESTTETTVDCKKCKTTTKEKEKPKETLLGIEAELLPETAVLNGDAIFFFAGNVEHRQGFQKQRKYNYQMKGIRSLWGNNKVYFAGTYIKYEFPFQNITD